MSGERPKIGFACAYTPLALIDAAGFAPYRILPMGDWPDEAGRLLHDNICPHIKRILDRAVADDLPDLAGVVFINSCDAMQRLSDTWKKVRPNDKTILIDLPIACDEMSISYLSQHLSRLTATLSEWSGNQVEESAIENSLERYATLTKLFDHLQKRSQRGRLAGGSARMQELYNRAATEPLSKTIELLKEVIAEPEESQAIGERVPLFLFGNVLPDPEAFSLFESCGVHVVSEDLCTGSRLLSPININSSEDLMTGLARSLLARPPCARTFDPTKPGKIAQDVLAKARECDARGVIAHTVKFCDPYLARLPAVRDTLREAGIPFLLLEGDCTMRSIGQHRTRIEAFVEMLR